MAPMRCWSDTVRGISAVAGIMRHPCSTWRSSSLLAIVLALTACGGEGGTALPPAVGDGGPHGDGAGPCKPETCATLKFECGKSPDGCGGVMDCGVCGADQFCGGGGPNRCGKTPCNPKTCQDLGNDCGSPSDQCENLLSCGVCTPPKTCGGGGVANVCGCQPATCTSLGKSCGSVPDGCGGTLSCGDCSDGVAVGTCIDNVCVHDCRAEAGYGNCGADGGGWGGSDCDPSHKAGCVDWWFSGWCNRRADYSMWLGVMDTWTKNRCDTQQVGVVPPPPDGETLYYCVSSGLHRYECLTPLVLVFEGHRLEFTPAPGSSFDVAAWNASYVVDRPSAPWIALDRNHDGRINDGTELFGSGTVLADGRRGSNGFEALAELDSNRDGRVTRDDARWEELVLWYEAFPTEMKRLADLGVDFLELDYRVEPACDARGNCALERARFSQTDGLGRTRVGEVVDVHLKVQTLGTGVGAGGQVRRVKR